MKVKDIVTYLYTIAPFYMKEDWDNVGLICGHENADVKKILVALDASTDVLREAAEKGFDMVVSHHPMIFGGVKQVNDSSVTGKHVLFAIENKIACVNMHTNLDSVSEGVNDLLAEALDLQNISVAAPKGTDENGNAYGYVRVGDIAETSLAAFAQTVKEKLDCRGLRYADGGRPVKKVAVGGGACGDEIGHVLSTGCDTFVTADLKYHQFSEAKDIGLNLIDAGHYQTEVLVCRLLANKLQQNFPELTVEISEEQDDSIRFVV